MEITRSIGASGAWNPGASRNVAGVPSQGEACLSSRQYSAVRNYTSGTLGSIEAVYSMEIPQRRQKNPGC